MVFFLFFSFLLTNSSGCENERKGLERLFHLQVLKGFVVSDSCKIRDVAQNLTKLRKLSMRVGNQRKEKLADIGDFKALCILTISRSAAQRKRSRDGRQRISGGRRQRGREVEVDSGVVEEKEKKKVGM
ncbi:hypothetical protein C2S53_002626 [Perilla frutescens var. hirtella]|uniref:Uncharacterized protein n=1 Tax=Perilla frutescens var. hirtella TaxID=608512 RepID=A0AAD4IS07_PERFH|nr:hypothetical protein C2S53_002626 [Perilla frutescens var. hirtella]